MNKKILAAVCAFLTFSVVEGCTAMLTSVVFGGPEWTELRDKLEAIGEGGVAQPTGGALGNHYCNEKGNKAIDSGGDLKGAHRYKVKVKNVDEAQRHLRGMAAWAAGCMATANQVIVERQGGEYHITQAPGGDAPPKRNECADLGHGAGSVI